MMHMTSVKQCIWWIYVFVFLCGGTLHYVNTTKYIPFGIRFHMQIGIFMLTVVEFACDSLGGQRLDCRIIIIINEITGG